jgi:hypothetical protein
VADFEHAMSPGIVENQIFSLAGNVGDMSWRNVMSRDILCRLVYGNILGTQDCQSRVWPCGVMSDRH